MSASLRIEVESTAQHGESPVDRPKTFNELKAEREAAAAKFREDANRMREEQGVGGVVSEREERQREREERRRRLAEDRQERDEAWLYRQEQKQERQREKEEERRMRQQERDEDFADRQEVKAEREREKQEKAEQRRREIEQRSRESVDPKFLADRMLREQSLRNQTRQQYLQQTTGINPNGVMNRIANTMQNLRSILTGGRAGGMAVPGSINQGLVNAMRGATGGLGRFNVALAAASAVIGALHSAYKAAVRNLMEEAHRVTYLSPALRAQELRNNLRNMRTDRQIAEEFGGQMADVSDRQNRKENAERVIGLKISSMTEGLLGWADELYTSLVEWMAGTDKMSKDNSKVMSSILKLTEKQLDEMGISKNAQRDIADGLAIGQQLIKALGGDLSEDDPVRRFNENGKVNVLAPDVQNPGFIPDMHPQGWGGL